MVRLHATCMHTRYFWLCTITTSVLGLEYDWSTSTLYGIVLLSQKHSFPWLLRDSSVYSTILHCSVVPGTVPLCQMQSVHCSTPESRVRYHGRLPVVCDSTNIVALLLCTPSVPLIWSQSHLHLGEHLAFSQKVMSFV